MLLVKMLFLSFQLFLLRRFVKRKEKINKCKRVHANKTHSLKSVAWGSACQIKSDTNPSGATLETDFK